MKTEEQIRRDVKLEFARYSLNWMEEQEAKMLRRCHKLGAWLLLGGVAVGFVCGWLVWG